MAIKQVVPDKFFSDVVPVKTQYPDTLGYYQLVDMGSVAWMRVPYEKSPSNSANAILAINGKNLTNNLRVQMFNQIQEAFGVRVASQLSINELGEILKQHVHRYDNFIVNRYVNGAPDYMDGSLGYQHSRGSGSMPLGSYIILK